MLGWADGVGEVCLGVGMETQDWKLGKLHFFGENAGRSKRAGEEL